MCFRSRGKLSARLAHVNNLLNVESIPIFSIIDKQISLDLCYVFKYPYPTLFAPESVILFCQFCTWKAKVSTAYRTLNFYWSLGQSFSLFRTCQLCQVHHKVYFYELISNYLTSFFFTFLPVYSMAFLKKKMVTRRTFDIPCRKYEYSTFQINPDGFVVILHYTFIACLFHKTLNI